MRIRCEYSQGDGGVAWPRLWRVRTVVVFVVDSVRGRCRQLVPQQEMEEVRRDGVDPPRQEVLPSTRHLQRHQGRATQGVRRRRCSATRVRRDPRRKVPHLVVASSPEIQRAHAETRATSHQRQLAYEPTRVVPHGERRDRCAHHDASRHQHRRRVHLLLGHRRRQRDHGRHHAAQLQDFETHHQADGTDPSATIDDFHVRRSGAMRTCLPRPLQHVPRRRWRRSIRRRLAVRRASVHLRQPRTCDASHRHVCTARRSTPVQRHRHTSIAEGNVRTRSWKPFEARAASTEVHVRRRRARPRVKRCEIRIDRRCRTPTATWRRTCVAKRKRSKRGAGRENGRAWNLTNTKK